MKNLRGARLAVVMVALAVLAGCGAASVDPSDDAATIAQSPSPASSPVDSEEPTESPDPQPSPTAIPSVDPMTLTCEDAPADVMSAIAERWGQNVLLPGARAVMVEVGEGTTAGEMWWIVAANAPGSTSEHPDLFGLTNVPSQDKPSGDTWISLPASEYALSNIRGWQHVDWPLEKLGIARAAALRAISCLAQ
ncbi:MAG: hypothetical protein LBH13_08210 [Cellulomonadaceae bacterium]|jgi:hypothetical protein|nr:hypothetical protein [Cellulomonadaceae bacterium]